MPQKRTLRKIKDPHKSEGVSVSELERTPSMTEYILGGKIKSVNFPNSIKVGEPHGMFRKGMLVYGPVSCEKIVIDQEYITWDDQSGIRVNGGNVQFKNGLSGQWLNIGSSTQGVTSIVEGNGITVNSTTGDVTVTADAADSTINVSSNGIKVVSVPNSLTIGNGVTLSSGTTYNGSSAVTLSVDTSDSKITVASGGITVNESALTIPNNSLENDSVTISTGTGLGGGASCDLGDSITLTNTGVTSIVAGSGVSIDTGQGAVTLTNTAQGTTSGVAAYSVVQPDPISNGATTLAASNGTETTVPFSTTDISNGNVVSGVSGGVFTLSTSATGNYLATATFPVTVLGGSNSSNYELKVYADLNANGSFTLLAQLPISSLAVGGVRTAVTTDGFTTTANSAKLKYTLQKLNNTGTAETLTGYPAIDEGRGPKVQISLV